MTSPPMWLQWLLFGAIAGHLATVFGWVIASGFSDWRLRRRRLSRAKAVRHG